MVSDKLIRFLETREESKEVVRMSQCIKELTTSLEGVKEELSKTAAELYLKNDIDGIQKLLHMSQEIDEYIKEIYVLDFEGESGENQNIGKKITDNDVPENIKLRVVTKKICPECGAALIDSRTTYAEFTDKRKRRIAKMQVAATYECPECGGQYIHKQMESLIDISRTNIVLIEEEA